METARTVGHGGTSEREASGVAGELGWARRRGWMDRPWQSSIREIYREAQGMGCVGVGAQEISLRYTVG